jgi:hypothetical protein
MRRDFAVTPGHAATCQRRVSKQSNKAHHGDSPDMIRVSNFCTDELCEKAREPSPNHPKRRREFRAFFLRGAEVSEKSRRRK